MQLVVATRNKGKLKEIQALLSQEGVEVLGLDAFADAPEVEEDGATFEANARKKAVTLARHTGCLTLADDSGLQVDALAGAPGVHSARYAGDNATDADNNLKLLRQLEGVPAKERDAAFVCVMALCEPDGSCQIFEGRFEGRILEAPRGEGGFGYDPLFFVPFFDKALAEVPLEQKNAVSHRGQALRALVTYLGRQG